MSQCRKGAASSPNLRTYRLSSFGFLEEESAMMIGRPRPAAGVVVGCPAKSIDIGCIPWIIYYRIVGVGVVDYGCYYGCCVSVGRIGVYRVGVGIGRVIPVRICWI